MLLPLLALAIGCRQPSRFPRHPQVDSSERRPTQAHHPRGKGAGLRSAHPQARQQQEPPTVAHRPTRHQRLGGGEGRRIAQQASLGEALVKYVFKRETYSSGKTSVFVGNYVSKCKRGHFLRVLKYSIVGMCRISGALAASKPSESATSAE